MVDGDLQAFLLIFLHLLSNRALSPPSLSKSPKSRDSNLYPIRRVYQYPVKEGIILFDRVRVHLRALPVIFLTCTGRVRICPYPTRTPTR